MLHLGTSASFPFSDSHYHQADSSLILFPGCPLLLTNVKMHSIFLPTLDPRSTLESKLPALDSHIVRFKLPLRVT